MKTKIRTTKKKTSKLSFRSKWLSPRRAVPVIAVIALIGSVSIIRSFAAIGDKYYIPVEHLVADVGYGPTADTATLTLKKDTVGSKKDVTVAELAVSKTGRAFRRYYLGATAPPPYNVQLPDEKAYQLWFSGRMGKRVRACANVRALDTTTITMTNMWDTTYPTSAYNLATSTTYETKCSPATVVTTVKDADYRMHLGISNDPSKVRIANFYLEELNDNNPSPKPFGYGDTNGPSGTWNLQFNENFNGTALNTDVWTHGWVGGANPVQDQETACYDPSQVKVENGELVLSAIAKPIVCSKGDFPGDVHPYTSGNIDSHTYTKDGKNYGKEYAYGYFEARIWLDEKDGKIANWPAWWLDGKNWPDDGELDIMEGLSGNANSTWHARLIDGDTDKDQCQPPIAKGGVRTGWHHFAAEWKPGKVIAYYDGVKIGELSDSATCKITSAKQFMILGLQMSPEGKYGGPVKAPSEMKVDYVRVWQR